MITSLFTIVKRKGSPFEKLMPKDKAIAFFKRRKEMGDLDKWEAWAVRGCICCGGAPAWPNGHCSKHQGRSPCVIEGCAKTRAGDAPHLCGEHWKLYCPAGSPERRALNRLFRLAKKLGYARTVRWPDNLENRYWRLWGAICKRAKRRSTEGDIDQREIERMFGWDKS